MAFFTAGFFSLGGVGLLSILESSEFRHVGSSLLDVVVDGLSVYMDGSLINLGSTNVRAGVTVFFEDVNLDLGVRISGLLSSTLAELQLHWPSNVFPLLAQFIFLQTVKLS
ncbi:hypothetical protein G9A89_022105 [Geosiphon pyriformis]|nr:hypothetical protein G9A89_022105 [Geosiphon pyriformis]